MTLAALTVLIHAASDKWSGCSVEFTTINTPETSRGSMYGIVTYGVDENQFTFHNEEELMSILKRISK